MVVIHLMPIGIYRHDETPVDQEWGRSASSLETSWLRLLTLEEVALTNDLVMIIIVMKFHIIISIIISII